jgi:hypothetical protein
MGCMKKSLYALVIAIFTITPVSASAATPSPALGTLLATAPAGSSRVTSGPLQGQLTATSYAQQYQSKALEAGITLIHDGFVDGYGLEWFMRSTNQDLVEFVIAFSGGKGAKDWLGYMEAADKSDPTYTRADKMSGIDPYYGSHTASTSPRVFTDFFAFVKGNDLFAVGVVSAQDDALKLVSAQTRRQYNGAPAETIPKATWPENRPSQRPQTNFLAAIIGGVLVLIIVGVVIRFVMVRRRTT